MCNFIPFDIELTRLIVSGITIPSFHTNYFNSTKRIVTNDSQFLSRLKYNRAKVLSLSLPLNDIVRSGSIGGEKRKNADSENLRGEDHRGRKREKGRSGGKYPGSFS